MGFAFHCSSGLQDDPLGHGKHAELCAARAVFEACHSLFVYACCVVMNFGKELVGYGSVRSREPDFGLNPCAVNVGMP